MSSLQSDLATASTSLKLYSVDKGSMPDTVSSDCTVSPDSNNNKCLKPSAGSTFGYKKYGRDTFMLVSISGNTCWSVTESSAPINNCVAIGSQVWMRNNLNVGTMITAPSSQTNNSEVEKYCYGNDASNCTTYGSLHQWDEAMQYITTEGAQGICPTGFHIPTYTEWDDLNNYLGPATAGDQLKTSGTTGFNGKMGGFINSGVFDGFGGYTYFWSSSLIDPSVSWSAFLASSESTLFISDLTNSSGFQVRCLKN